MSNHQNHDNFTAEPSSSEPDASRQHRPGRWKRAGRFTLKLLLVVGGMFLLMVLGLMLMSSFSLEGIDGFRQSLGRADSFLFYVRLLLIGLLIGFWRQFNSWLGYKKNNSNTPTYQGRRLVTETT